jgi:protein arginine kinase activator
MSDDWNETLNRTCPNCKTTFEDFAQTAALGCVTCYETFGDLLEPVIRRMHGVAKRPSHGTPPDMAPQSQSVASENIDPSTKLNFMVRDELEMELHLALLEEDYERAAQIRDKLKSL